jgi:C4-dicarboxylate transporter, DctQ subunit
LAVISVETNLQNSTRKKGIAGKYENITFMKRGNGVKKILYALDNLDSYLAVLCLSITILLLAVQVVSRYVFNWPIAMAEEVSRFAFVWAVYMGVSMAARNNEHIRIVVHLKLLFPVKIYNKIIVFADLITLAFSITLFVVGIQVLFSLAKFPYIAAVTNISMVWIYTIIPIAFLAYSIRTIQMLLLRKPGEDLIKEEEIGL